MRERWYVEQLSQCFYELRIVDNSRRLQYFDGCQKIAVLVGHLPLVLAATLGIIKSTSALNGSVSTFAGFKLFVSL